MPRPYSESNSGSSSSESSSESSSSSDSENEPIQETILHNPYSIQEIKYVSKYLDDAGGRNFMLNRGKQQQQQQQQAQSAVASGAGAGATTSGAGGGDTVTGNDLVAEAPVQKRSVTDGPAGGTGSSSVTASAGRTIKAATRHIDAQGKKAAMSRHHSHSMNDLTILAQYPHRPNSAELETSPDQLTNGTPNSATQTSESINGSHPPHPLSASSLAGMKNGLDSTAGPKEVPNVVVRAIIESQYDCIQRATLESATGHSVYGGRDSKTDIKRKKRYSQKRLMDRDQLKLGELNEEDPSSDGSRLTGRMGGESSGNGTNTGTTPTGLELECAGSSQFSCLPSRPVYHSSFRFPGSGSIRSISFQAPDCPLERVQFYKSLAQLLRAGRVKRESDSFIASSASMAGGFVELVYKQELRDLIWLEVKTWFENRTMIEQDSYLCEERLKIADTMQKIMAFDLSPSQRTSRSESLDQSNASSKQELIRKCVNPDKLPLTPAPSLNSTNSLASGSVSGLDLTSGYTSDTHETPDLRTLIDQDTLAASVAAKLNMSESSSSSMVELSDELHSRKCSIISTTPTYNEDDNCSCSETLSRLCQNCVDKETEAINRVNAIIVSLEEAEHLYPCTRALAHDYPVYLSKDFQARIKSMYLFVNVTRDFRQKIDLLARLFMIQNRGMAGWPVFDQTEPSTAFVDSLEATPELGRSAGSNFESMGYSSRMNAPPNLNPFKQVHFKNLDPHDSISSDKTMSAPDSPEVHSNTSAEVFESMTPTGIHSSGINSDSSRGSKDNPFFPPAHKSIYRKYVDKALKNKGLRDINQQLSGLLRPLLFKVHAALKRPVSMTYAEVSGQNNLTVADQPETQRTAGPLSREYCEEISQYGVWSIAYQQMGLPTLHRPFLFLLRVTLDVLHECLKLRLEQQPEQPSHFSIGQLIRECKEVLRAGVQIRQRYVNLAQTVLGEGGSEVIEAQLDGFDEDLKTMLSVYLNYLETRMGLMQTYSSSETTSRAMSTSTRLKSYLEEEWNFVRSIRPHIPGGESLAADKFCLMSSNFLSFICTSIRTGIDNCIANYNQSIVENQNDVVSFRKAVLQTCRQFKSVFQDASTRACQATALAKTLRKDLEIAAEFKINADIDTLCKKLRETGHIRIVAPNSMNHLMFVPNYLQSNETLIWHLVDMTCGGRNMDHASVEPDSGGYLAVVLCKDIEVNWSGPVVVLEPTAEATISLSHVESTGLLLVAHHPSHLFQLTIQFQNIMSGVLQIDRRQTACNHETAKALTDLKNKALEIQHKISQSLNLIYDQFSTDRFPGLEPTERNTLEARCLEVMHMGFKFGFEYEKNLTRLITGEARTNLSRQLLTFASQWMRFVMTKCEKGRGLRTRWTNNGLQFLLVAMEPQFLQILNDEEYMTLKNQLDSCLTHILGTSDRSTKQLLSTAFLQANKPYSVLADAPTNKPLASSLNFHRSASVSTAFSDGNLLVPRPSTAGGPIKGTRLEEWDKAKGKWKPNNGKHIEQSAAELPPLERIRQAVQKVEEKREENLREGGVIGNVSSVIIQRVPLHITTRKVAFAWQRGFKIGEGRFGKVYTAVNNTTGELIAMKEIKLLPNDHRSVKETIDEIRTFEGIKHHRIVRYFGVEIHREEMYIFMEYCNEGSLENTAQLHLPETLVRKYTFQLLDAVNCLHENGIVHRDIKSANIFLTSEGNLKLGDFGCCTKLKSHTTMPGEVNAFVGTPAYMAPEVFTRNPVEGHGRAADIWSLGCVVLEMLTARQPWQDVDNPYQIMFRVGMGEAPEVPDELPVEGRNFIYKCLQHDPRLRWSAGQLMTHPFTKVTEEEDDL